MSLFYSGTSKVTKLYFNDRQFTFLILPLLSSWYLHFKPPINIQLHFNILLFVQKWCA